MIDQHDVHRKFWLPLGKPQVEILSPFTQYWSLRVERGLYIWLRDLPRLAPLFLVELRAPRAHFRAILVQLLCTRSQKWDHSRVVFDSEIIERTTFWHQILSGTIASERIESLRRESSPHTTKSVKKWVLWIKITHDRYVVIFRQSRWDLIFLFHPIHGYYRMNID